MRLARPRKTPAKAVLFVLNSRAGRPFSYSADGLCCDQVPLTRLARRWQTPLYVYSWSAIAERFAVMQAATGKALPDSAVTLCYAVKANSNLEILRRLARLGAGFDIVSGGELERVRLAAPDALPRVVFSGVGKTAAEIDAALAANILLFNAESAAELDLLAARARRAGRVGCFALRVNPNVPAETHPYISTGLARHKFGVPMGHARALYQRAREVRWLKAVGVSVHVGSQIRETAPFAKAAAQVAELARRLVREGDAIQYFDAGGGLGVDYDPEAKFDAAAVTARYCNAVAAAWDGPPVHWLFEPGRFLTAQAGCLVCRVLLTKQNGSKNFAVVDAGMNDLLRPALYGARHAVVRVTQRKGKRQKYDVVGPVCETADSFASGVELNSLQAGDLLAILDAGAYGMSLSSNYNARPRAAEVLVDAKRSWLVRRRETTDDLVRQEVNE